MSMRELPIIGPKSYTKAWWNKRNKTIGASEAAAIMGMSRWSMPYDVYKKRHSRLVANTLMHPERRRSVGGTRWRSSC